MLENIAGKIIGELGLDDCFILGIFGSICFVLFKKLTKIDIETNDQIERFEIKLADIEEKAATKYWSKNYIEGIRLSLSSEQEKMGIKIENINKDMEKGFNGILEKILDLKTTLEKISHVQINSPD